MIGLKSYLPVLARHLNTSEAVLYERQRKLTQAGLLVGTAGRGPGSGIRITAPNVALVVMAMMVTDDLADVAAKTEILASKSSNSQRCPLTGAATFGSALELIFASESMASTIRRVDVVRSTLLGEISYRAKNRRSSYEASYFGKERGLQETGLQSRYWVPEPAILSISRELSAIAAGKSLNITRTAEEKNAAG